MSNGLFIFPEAQRRRADVEDWFEKCPGDLGLLARHWFNVMRACGDDVTELLHDLHPTACVNEAAFGYVNAFTSHVNVGFFRGAELSDPQLLLAGSGKLMRHVKLTPGKIVIENDVKTLIEEAYKHMKVLVQDQKEKTHAG